MKVALIFIVLWNTMPTEVEKSTRGYFNTMEECQTTVVEMAKVAKVLGMPYLIHKNDINKGQILRVFCEKEAQAT